MKYLFLYFLVLAGAVGNAQSAVADSIVRISSVGAGYQFQSFRHLGDHIGVRPEYVKPGNNYANAQFGVNTERNRRIVEILIHVARGTVGDGERKSTTMMNMGTNLHVGYNFTKKRNVRLYPYIGIAIERYWSTVRRDVSAIPFDSILNFPTVQERTRAVVFNNTFLCYQGGLAMDYQIDNIRYLSCFGLRISYTGSIQSRSWRVNDNQLIANAPRDKVGQLNISLLIGFGTRRPDKT